MRYLNLFAIVLVLLLLNACTQQLCDSRAEQVLPLRAYFFHHHELYLITDKNDYRVTSSQNTIQDMENFLASPLGQKIIANSAKKGQPIRITANDFRHTQGANTVALSSQKIDLSAYSPAEQRIMREKYEINQARPLLYIGGDVKLQAIKLPEREELKKRYAIEKQKIKQGNVNYIRAYNTCDRITDSLDTALSLPIIFILRPPMGGVR